MVSLWGEFIADISRSMLILFLFGVVEAIVDFNFRKNPRRYPVKDERWERHVRQMRRRIKGYTLISPLFFLWYALLYVSTQPLVGNWVNGVTDSTDMTGIFICAMVYPMFFILCAYLRERHRRHYDQPYQRGQSQRTDGSHESL